MKKFLLVLKQSIVIFSFGMMISCGSSDSETNATPGDIAQPVPGTNDSVPGVVNPGKGNPESTIKTQPTNDNNTIMPDSTTIAQ